MGQREYESARKRMATPTVEHSARQQSIVHFFENVIVDYTEKNDNLVLTTTYFCDEHLQEKFNSFILDERTAPWKHCQHFVSNLKKAESMKIKSVYSFIESLIVKFCKLYSVDKVADSYYYYVERFAYICVISIEEVDVVLAKVLAMPKGQKEHAKLANKHQYALFAKLLRAKYIANAGST